MTEPDYSKMTLADLEDIARHIDARKVPERHTRLTAEIERRYASGSARDLAEAARLRRQRVFARAASVGGIAGAFFCPISLLLVWQMLAAGSRSNVWSNPFLDPFNFMGAIPLGWMLGVVAGLCWAALHIRHEEYGLDRAEVWRDALGAGASLMVYGCFLTPFLIVVFVLLFAIVVSGALWVSSYF